MRNLLKAMQERLTANEALVLVTITAASGATPRGTGARMLVGKDGRICGTIGGGAVEYRAEQTALQVMEGKVSRQQSFALNREDVQNLGMICGGDVNLFFHYIPEGDTAASNLAREAERLFAAGYAIWLISDISAGSALSLYTKEHGFYGHPVPEWIAQHLSRKPVLVENWCIEQIHTADRVYIFGCGHVSRELEPVLSHVGFRCVMLDDRPEFARRESFPTAEDVQVIDFSRIDESISIGPDDYVCIMTRGHAHDTVVQAQVLKRRPCYVGVIGSRKKAAAVRQALQTQYGMTDSELDLITTPIGLDIGAETPAEIAISIAGQMIQVRAEKKQK